MKVASDEACKNCK